MTRAVVVGSGPNGLVAAVTLAAAGVQVTVLEAADVPGGGLRSLDATVPGLIHDECAGFHPFGAHLALGRLDLAARGLRWAWPAVQYAHPLDGGAGAAAVRSVDDTAAALGADARAYRRLIGPISDRFTAVAQEILQPVGHWPGDPVALSHFGFRAPWPASWTARTLATEPGRALWAGVAAHAFQPLDRPLTSAFGVALGAAAHAYGWPVAVGGSGSVARALVGLLEDLGGIVETGVRVTDLRALGRQDVVLLDTAPGAAADLAGDLLPARTRAAYRRWRHGAAAFQVAVAVDGGIPWTFEPARRSGTVHVGGTFDEVASAERDVAAGTMPRRPFVLVGQQYVADPSRAVGSLVPVDCYAHVPRGFAGDATEAILTQLERFAPGTRERVVQVASRSTSQIAAGNPNFVGGDIATGAKTPMQTLAGPRLRANPYRTGAPGIYLCSAATPPGPGAHGICGYLAAATALRDLRR